MPKITVIIPVYNQEGLVLRAIKSIPKSKDIEIIVINDGSTDKTYQNVLEYVFKNDDQNIWLYNNEQNKGVAYTVNKGYDYARGEYIVLLGSDDYFYTEQFKDIIEELDGTDLVYFDMKVNNGDVWKINNDSKHVLCGSVKFMRREFIGDTRCPEDRRTAEDLPFYQELLKKNPTEKFTHKVVKHYNHPRENSLTDLTKKGVISV